MSRDPLGLYKHFVLTRQSTELMQRAVAVLCGLIVLHVSNTRFILKTAQRVARIVRDIIVQEEWNALIAAKSTMLRTPSWRNRVLRDLGGNAALLDWEARDARAQNPQPAFTHKIPKQVVTRQNENHTLPESQMFYDACKIDQEGEFRLPPLARRGCKRTQAPRLGSATQPKRRILTNRVIAVFPAEFRAACLHSKPLETKTGLGRQPRSETVKTHTGHGIYNMMPYHAPIRGQP